MATSTPELTVDNSKIIVVSGYNFGRYDLDFVQDCWWILQSYIYHLPEDQRPEQMKSSLCVVNDTALLTEVYEKHVEQLHEMFWVMPVNEAGITRVVFAHSHGARIVYEALKHDSLLSFLKGRGIPEPNERIRKIRDHLAVITLGGIQDIPEVFAKICLKLVFANDWFSIVGKKLFGINHQLKHTHTAKVGKELFAENHGHEVNVKVVGTVHPAVDARLKELPSDEEYLSIYHDLLANNGCSVPEHGVALPFGFIEWLPFVRHAFKDYCTDASIREEIRSNLGLEDIKDRNGQPKQ